MNNKILGNGNYLLFDDDCGICTLFAYYISWILGPRIEMVAMHLSPIENEGTVAIGSDYWESFHIVKNGRWYTDGGAILSLASILPLGSFLRYIASFPPIYWFLIFLLEQMKKTRTSECSIDFS